MLVGGLDVWQEHEEVTLLVSYQILFCEATLIVWSWHYITTPAFDKYIFLDG